MYFMHFFMVKKGKEMGHLRMLCMNISIDFIKACLIQFLLFIVLIWMF